MFCTSKTISDTVQLFSIIGHMQCPQVAFHSGTFPFVFRFSLRERKTKYRLIGQYHTAVALSAVEGQASKQARRQRLPLRQELYLPSRNAPTATANRPTNAIQSRTC